MQQYNTVTGNIEHVREFVDVIWNRRQVDAINDYLAEDYLDHAYQPGNVQGLLAMLNELGAAFPDARQDIETITAQDDMVVCRMHLQATHTGAFRTSPAAGTASTFHGRPLARWKSVARRLIAARRSGFTSA